MGGALRGYLVMVSPYFDRDGTLKLMFTLYIILAFDEFPNKR